MNLLGAKLYDPAVAVSKATSALLAMTALDTTNLRVAVTVPAHGMLHFVLKCTIEGATTFPQILLGVMNGATVVGRVTPQVTINGTALATTRLACWAEFTATGLTPGAMNCDAAYGVEILIALTNIKYGGPNDTTTDNAWGAFAFEVYDPQPIPVAAPGAANGLQICGSNAASTYATMSVTGQMDVGNLLVDTTTVLTGAVSAPAGITAAITGNLSGSVGSVTGFTASDVGAIKTTIGAAGAGLTALPAMTLAASQHVIVDSGTVTTLTNLPSITAGWLTATGIAAAAFNGKGDWNIGKTGYTLTQTFPTNFSAMSISAAGLMTLAPVTHTGAIIPTVSAVTGLTASNLDATVSSRSTYAGGAVASVTGAVGSVTGLAVANLDAAVSSRLAAGSYVAPDNATLTIIAKITRNKIITDPATGILTVYDDDSTTPLLTAQLYKDAAGTITYAGNGAERRQRMV